MIAIPSNNESLFIIKYSIMNISKNNVEFIPAFLPFVHHRLPIMFEISFHYYVK